MFVEEGFRVRFANGETIDFYADSPADKEGWMRALAEVVGKENKSSKSWTEIVLKRERSLQAKAAGRTNASRENNANTTGMRSAPATPGGRKSSQSKGVSYSRPLSHHNGAQVQHGHHQQQQHNKQIRPNSADKPLPAGGRDPRTMAPAERRQKTKSMIF